MNSSKTGILCIAVQILLNFIFYTLFMKYSSEFTSELLFMAKTISIIIYIVLFQLITSFLLRSIVLSFLNTFLLINISFSKILITGRIWVLTILFAPLLISTILFKLFSINDIVIDIVKNRKTVFSKNINYRNIFRKYASYFALVSITLPLVTFTYSYLLINLLNINYYSVHSILTIYLFINVSLSLITLVSIDKPINIIETSLLTTVSIWSLTPLLAYSIKSLTESSIEKSIDYLKPRSPEKGVLLGSVRARLRYGIPRGLYNGFEQEWIRNTRRKTWFWSEYVDTLILDPSKLLNKHIVIMGSSGSGKSLLAKNIAIEYYIKHGVKFIVFDPHNEYYILKKYISDLEVIDASTLSLNPLEIGRSSPRERAHQLSSVIMSIFKLGHLQRQTIEELILKTYEYFGIFPDSPSTWSNKPPTLGDVLDICRKTLSEPELREVYGKVYPYIRVLADNVFSGTSLSFSRVFDKPSVIVLSNLKSDYVRLLYVDTFLYRLVNMMYRRELRGEYIVVLDEAYTLFTRDYSRHVISKLLVESRKYGIGIIYITQYPLLTPQPVIENAAVKIAFNITEPRNLDYVSRLFSGIYHGERLNAIRNALRNVKSLNYLLSISGLNDILIISEEDVVKYLLENNPR